MKPLKTNRTTLFASLLLSSGLFLAASAPAEEETKPAPQPQTLVTINGQDITDMEVLAFNALQGKQPASTREAQVKLLNQLINTTLIAQQGEKAGLEKLPNVKAAIDMARLQVLAEAQVNNYLTNHPVTEEEIKAAYEKKYTPENLQEYKVRHILVQTEDEAKEVIASLDKGADFAELAKTKSLDPSKDTGGELGWISRQQVVKPFGDAMVKVKKGTYSKEPVQTPFGWHVIQIEEIRKQEAPPLEEVKAQLANELRQKKLAEYITGLRQSAKIELAGAEEAKKEGKEKK